MRSAIVSRDHDLGHDRTQDFLGFLQDRQLRRMASLFYSFVGQLNVVPVLGE